MLSTFLMATDKPKDIPIKSFIWKLSIDQSLFQKIIFLKFYYNGNKLEAISTDSRGQFQSQARSSPVIWNLSQKDGEYLYGWIRGQKNIYRCKLWQRKEELFFRIYTSNLYNTYKLMPISFSK